MIRFSIEVSGEKVLDRAFNRVENTIEDLTPVWKAVEQKFHEIEAENFRSENAKGASGRWKPLSPAYERQKIARFGTFAVIAGVMIATEDLYKSLTRKTEHTVSEYDKQEAAFGTSLKYARYHQEGRGRLPQRKVIDLSDSQKTELQKTIQRELVTIIRKDSQLGTLLTEK